MGKVKLTDGPAGWGPATVKATEKFVRDELAGMDGSHDWWHIDRVRRIALEIAKAEGSNGEEHFHVIVELSALLHDVKDRKYSGDEDAGATAVKEFLDGLSPELRPAHCMTKRIVDVCKLIGFKDELGSSKDSKAECYQMEELCVVQDADRLDAIGAIGIGRTFCYGGAKGHAMHVPGVEPRANLTKEDYVGGTHLFAKKTKTEHVDTTINHFHEKLLKLRGMMKTRTGRLVAKTRHERMVAFLKAFHEEWKGADVGAAERVGGRRKKVARRIRTMSWTNLNRTC